jgi:hypothetical protein
MLSVAIIECHNAECHYAECHYAECHYAECQYDECHGASILNICVFYSSRIGETN